jgi:hypothetical protein
LIASNDSWSARGPSSQPFAAAAASNAYYPHTW